MKELVVSSEIKIFIRFSSGKMYGTVDTNLFLDRSGFIDPSSGLQLYKKLSEVLNTSSLHFSSHFLL